jgi:diguanylate cyclase (GGDEF)-like protein
VHPEDREVAGALIDRVRTADAEVELRAEMRMRHADDSLHWHEVVVRNLLSDPRVSSILCHLRDVTEARAAYEQIAHAATHDGLTGLVNRAVFDRDLERALAHSRRYGHGVAVLFCDLDGFKAINDGHGHHAGDRLLASVGASIARNTRACDTVARLGGDEFAVVLTRVNDADDALGVARRIIAGISLDPTVVHTKPAVGCSVGVAFTSGSSSGVDAPTLLQRADAAMYQAKRRRRNAAHLHS